MAWDCVADVQGDDGRQYWIVVLPVTTMGECDAWAMSVSWVKGKVSQYPNTAYNIADFPPGLMSGWHVYPDGTHKLKKSKDKVEFDLGDCHLVCKDDKTWHFSVEDKEQGIKLEMVHHGSGYPCWCGKEKSRTFAPHIVVYGYYCSGRIDGTLTIGEHKVRIKGSGVRERVYGVSACPAEGGGWHDLIWFHFDEMFGCVDEMKCSKFKLMSQSFLIEK